MGDSPESLAAGQPTHGSSSSLPGSVEAQRAPRKRRTNAEARKRDHYVSRACEACKRRKQRCDGMVPCRRCHRASVECVYLQPLETARRRQHQKEEPPMPWDPEVRPGVDILHLTNLLSSMQKKIDTLTTQLKSADISVPTESQGLEQQQPSKQLPPHAPLVKSTTEPVFDRSRLRQRITLPVRKKPLPDYHGPTSSKFPLGMARSLLESTTSPANSDGDEEPAIPFIDTEDRSPVEDDMPYHRCPESIDILESIGWRESSRLVDVWEECLGTLHPILDVSVIHKHISVIFSKIYSGPKPDEVDSAVCVCQDDISILKFVLAIASLAEGAGESNLASALYASLKTQLQHKIIGNKIDMKGQIMLILAGIYHFFQDQAKVASRMVAIAARMTLESGLQNREVLFNTFPDKEKRNKAIIVLWSIYVLDRQFSFAAGVPQALQDSDIDVPTAEGADYLVAMASYVKIGSKAWEAACDRHGRMKASCNNDTLDFIEYQLSQWQRSLPIELQADTLLLGYNADIKESPSIRCVRTLLFLRANQIRLLVGRGLLFSSALAVANRTRVLELLERAKEMIRVLARLDLCSDIYRIHQVIFNHFLASALTVLSLFLAHEPRQRKSKNSPFKTTDFLDSRDGISLAFDLVRKYSTSSGSSRRLWKTFGGMKDLFASLGFLRREDVSRQQSTPNTTSQVTSKSNENDNPQIITQTAVFNAASQLTPPATESVPSISDDQAEPAQMQYDLTEFFGLLGTNSGLQGSLSFPDFDFNAPPEGITHAADAIDGGWAPSIGPDGSYPDVFYGGGGNMEIAQGPQEFSWVFQDML